MPIFVTPWSYLPIEVLKTSLVLRCTLGIPKRSPRTVFYFPISQGIWFINPRLIKVLAKMKRNLEFSCNIATNLKTYHSLKFPDDPKEYILSSLIPEECWIFWIIAIPIRWPLFFWDFRWFGLLNSLIFCTFISNNFAKKHLVMLVILRFLKITSLCLWCLWWALLW